MIIGVSLIALILAGAECEKRAMDSPSQRLQMFTYMSSFFKPPKPAFTLDNNRTPLSLKAAPRGSGFEGAVTRAYPPLVTKTPPPQCSCPCQ